MAFRRLFIVLAGAVGLSLSAASAQDFKGSNGPIETVTVTASRTQGPGVSPNGANQYGASAADISNLPTGTDTTITDVLTQMPGVAIDQNQQIHIRNTEGPQFQYQINGVFVPFDINTNPPFISALNPDFISRLNLMTGILPSRYSYATGGVVDITTKDGCTDPGGSFTFFGGQRGTIEPSAAYGGCDGKFSYYADGQFQQSDMGFSSATPGPDAIHDHANQGQVFGYFTYDPDPDTRLSLVVSSAASDNQLPNVPGLGTEFTLAGVTPEPSADINSYLNFRDALAIGSVSGEFGQRIQYQLSYSFHTISEEFRPDDAGELIYQGVASHASHDDIDNTLEGDIGWETNGHNISTGFYLGSYRVSSDDNSLVFPGGSGTQSSTTPETVVNNAHADNILSGIYINDLWQINDQFRLNMGLRWDGLTGFTHHNQFNPTIALSWLPSDDTTLHAGFARYMQVPSFQGISPTASASFMNTTAEGPNGIATPTTEDDYEWDAGIVHHFTPELTISEDNFYEITHHYLDTGQFGVVPIFAPFNYEHGYIWGNELALNYRNDDGLSAYANLTFGRNTQEGVATGQFNFDPTELAYINSNHIVLDHQPKLGSGFGATYDWKPWSFSVDGTYSSGLRGGFADQDHLPNNMQINASIQRSFDIPGIGEVSDRIIFLNVLDRVNLIRPSEGIGIFQSAYGPRFTVYDALTIPF